jgi:A/G-specific adenine glycosylase
MLQQTRTECVQRKYPLFVDRFPALSDLAGADTASLLRAWRGLGYNRRALALREAARRIVDIHGGIVPDDPAVLATFPGIGPATAASIAVFAYDVPVAFIETNIRRVHLYFFFPGRAGVHDREILPYVERTLDRRRPRYWYTALMDYGVMMKSALPVVREPDPNHRSAHYTRQARFEGSDRQIRGRVLRILTDEGPLSARELQARLAQPARVQDRSGPIYALRSARAVEHERVERLLAALRAEGFVARSGSRVRLA